MIITHHVYSRAMVGLAVAVQRVQVKLNSHIVPGKEDGANTTVDTAAMVGVVDSTGVDDCGTAKKEFVGEWVGE